MIENIFVAGVGGQGIITLCNLLSEHAAACGLKTSFFQARGMAHRGGRVAGEIRIADKEHFGPRISHGGADILIGLEIAELINSFAYLKDRGIVIIMNYSLIPSETILKKKAYPCMQEAAGLFSNKTDNIYTAINPVTPLNLFCLGFFSSVKALQHNESDVFTGQNLKKTIETRMKKNLNENLKAFELGYEYAKESKHTF